MLFNEPKLLKSHRRGLRVLDLRRVSVLFNEPKLLKCTSRTRAVELGGCFSALQRAEIAEIRPSAERREQRAGVSVLFNEPKLLKSPPRHAAARRSRVSVLFNEPKLLKYRPPLPAPPVSQIPIPARRRS